MSHTPTPSAAVIAATRDAETARTHQAAANRELAEAVALSNWLMERPSRATLNERMN